MRSNSVPPPPVASWMVETNAPDAVKSRIESTDAGKKYSRTAPTSLAPMGAAFLGRVYRSVLWFGLFAVGLVWISCSSGRIAGAFAAGALLAAILLKTQEMFVRRILRPRDAEPYKGWDRFIPLWVMVPVKYGAVTAALGYGFHHHWILPAPFVLGFGVVQLVIIAKVMGYLLSRQIRTVRETYIETQNVQS